MIETSTQRPLPIWLSLVIIVLSLGIGGGLLYWLLADARPAGEVVLAPPAESAAVNRAARRPPAPRAQSTDIVLNSKDNWSVFSGRGRMNIVVRENKPYYTFLYQTSDFATPEQYQLNMLARKVVTDKPTQEKLAVTPEQIQKLRPHTAPLGMKLSDADRAKLIELWTAHQQAAETAKADAKAKLLAALKDVADRSLPATRKAVEERSNAVKSVLTPEQLTKARQIG